MYSYIKGILVEKQESGIVVEANGIGYDITMAPSTLERLPACGNEVKIYTYLQVREDAHQLFGFQTRDDKNVFCLLIGVSGIGPKGAQAILSVLSTDDLRYAIISEDAKTIAKAPGIGNKTAQRLIIELKDKIKAEDAIEQRYAHEAEETNEEGMQFVQARRDALDALIALGYTPTEAQRAIHAVELSENMTAEQLLKESLKAIMKR